MPMFNILYIVLLMCFICLIQSNFKHQGSSILSNIAYFMIWAIITYVLTSIFPSIMEQYFIVYVFLSMLFIMFLGILLE